MCENAVGHQVGELAGDRVLVKGGQQVLGEDFRAAQEPRVKQPLVAECIEDTLGAPGSYTTTGTWAVE
jgi:hypothetical protein